MAAFVSCQGTAPLRGPLAVRNLHPAQQTVLHLPARASNVLEAGQLRGRADAGLANLWLRKQEGGNAMSLDGDYLRAEFGLAAGLGHGLELQAALPIAHTSGGFLDDVIEAWHDWFGFPDQDRPDFPENQWRVEYFEQGDRFGVVREETARLMDVPIVLDWNVQRAQPGQLGITLRTGVELPVGDTKRGFGNDGVDLGLGAMVEWRLGPDLALRGDVQHSFVQDDRRLPTGFTYSDVTAARGGVEFAASEVLTWHAQLEFETSTTRELDLASAQRDHLMLWLGARCELGGGAFVEFAFGEDLIGYVSPDVSFWLSFGFGPVGGGP